MVKIIGSIFLVIFLLASAQAQSLRVGRKMLFSKTVSSKPISQPMVGNPTIYFRVSDSSVYQRIGFLGNKLKPLLIRDELGKVEFKRFQRDQLLGFSCLGVGIGSYVALTYHWLSLLDKPSQVVIQEWTGPTSLSLLGASAVFTAASVLLRQSADKHLQNSVYLYNKSKLPALQDVGLNIVPNPSGGIFYGANLRFNISE